MFSWQKLPEKTCVLLGEPLASSGEMKDSPAHIIPSALGGRLKPKGFLSSRANNLLAQRVDTPFVDAFGQSLTYLAKIKRDRNKGTSTKLIAADKKSWRVSFEKSAIEPAKPDIDVTVLSDKSQSVKFSGTEEQFRQFLKSKNLEQHADKLIPAAIKISEPSPELQLGMKPIKAGHCSLAAWTSAALFAAHKLQIQVPAWVDYINGASGDTTLAPCVRFAPSALRIEEDFGTIAHGVALWDVPERQQLFGYLQTFGGMGMIVCLTEQWTSPVRCSYFVDPTTGKQGEPSFLIQNDAQSFAYMTDAPVKQDFTDTVDRISKCIEETGIGKTRIVVQEEQTDP